MELRDLWQSLNSSLRNGNLEHVWGEEVGRGPPLASQAGGGEVPLALMQPHRSRLCAPLEREEARKK